MQNITESLLIGFDYSNEKDNTVLIVGKRNPDKQQIEIINAFQGDEARNCYGNVNDPDDICIECEDCNEVLVSGESLR